MKILITTLIMLAIAIVIIVVACLNAAGMADDIAEEQFRQEQLRRLMGN